MFLRYRELVERMMSDRWQRAYEAHLTRLNITDIVTAVTSFLFFFFLPTALEVAACRRELRPLTALVPSLKGYSNSSSNTDSCRITTSPLYFLSLSMGSPVVLFLFLLSLGFKLNFTRRWRLSCCGNGAHSHVQ